MALRVNLRLGVWIQLRGVGAGGYSPVVTSLVRAVGSDGVKFRGDVADACKMPTIGGVTYNANRTATVALSRVTSSCVASRRSNNNGKTFTPWRPIGVDANTAASRALKLGVVGQLQIRAGAKNATIYLYLSN